MANVVLIYPATMPDYPGPEFDIDLTHGVPIGIMSVASFLEANGHQVKIIDGRLYPKEDVLHRVLTESRKTPDCFGFSVMTSQVRHALHLSDAIRESTPDIPIVWGGIHPTLFPEQTCNDDSVDYVVYGEGEFAFCNLLSHLNAGQPSLKEIEGIVYKVGPKVARNKVGRVLDVEKLFRPAYHLLDIEMYLDRTLCNGRRMRQLDILTSRGCPYRCAFCTNPILLERKWRPLPLERTLSDIDYLVSKYGLNSIWFMDDFFFGNVKRVRPIAEHLLSKYGDSIVWEANIRADNFRENAVNSEFLKLLKRSGCYALRMGAESGSNETLKLIKKDITVEQTVNAVRQCHEHAIRPFLFFMMGVPNETTENIMKTISFIFKLKEICPEALISGPGIFRPYPGGELYDLCVQKGFREPATLREWAEYAVENSYMQTADLPWVDDPQLLDDLMFYLMNHNNKDNIQALKVLGFPAIRKMLGTVAEWRGKYDFWQWRFEPRLASLYKGLHKRYVDLKSGR